MNNLFLNIIASPFLWLLLLVVISALLLPFFIVMPPVAYAKTYKKPDEAGKWLWRINWLPRICTVCFLPIILSMFGAIYLREETSPDSIQAIILIFMILTMLWNWCWCYIVPYIRRKCKKS